MDTNNHLLADEWIEMCFSSNSIKLQHKFKQKNEEIFSNQTSKPHSTPLTLKWLAENYELADAVCIPRSTLYSQYLHHCSTNHTQPVNAASFGKIIRQQFPQITTRRLGTRGQSKYHYYGIGIKETSNYFDIAFSKKGFFNGENKKDVLKHTYNYSPRSKVGTILPDFPDIASIHLPPSISHHKVATFLVMYRTHCQRILDNVVRANFDEIHSFLVHFWRGMPTHIVPLMTCPAVVDLIALCDVTLFKTLSSVLIPSLFQPVSDSLIQMIRKFARHIEEWVSNSLHNFPAILIQAKAETTRHFSVMLRRQASLNHLCQAVRSVLASPLLVRQMTEDWARVDFSALLKQSDKPPHRHHALILSFQKEFEELLKEQVSIETYCQWLHSIVERCVKKHGYRSNVSTLCRHFLLLWSTYASRVVRDLSLQNQPTFGSFHLLHLMFDEYVMYLVENIQLDNRTQHLLYTLKQQSYADGSKQYERQSVIFDTRNFYHEQGQIDAYRGTNFPRRPVISHSYTTHYNDPMKQPVEQSANHLYAPASYSMDTPQVPSWYADTSSSEGDFGEYVRRTGDYDAYDRVHYDVSSLEPFKSELHWSNRDRYALCYHDNNSLLAKEINHHNNNNNTNNNINNNIHLTNGNIHSLNNNIGSNNISDSNNNSLNNNNNNITNNNNNSQIIHNDLSKEQSTATRLTDITAL